MVTEMIPNWRALESLFAACSSRTFGKSSGLPTLTRSGKDLSCYERTDRSAAARGAAAEFDFHRIVGQSAMYAALPNAPGGILFVMDSLQSMTEALFDPSVDLAASSSLSLCRRRSDPHSLLSARAASFLVRSIFCS